MRRLVASETLQALAAPHGVERYVELLTGEFSVAEPRARIVAVGHPTPRSVTLRLAVNEAWRGFRAGQFLPVTVDVDGVRRTRCYSPANSQHAGDRELELTVRVHPQGLVSRFLAERAKPGLVLRLGQASGEFVLPEPRPPRLLLLSGGSGITPVMSMLRTLCDEDHGGPVTFLHYARTAGDVAYRAELDKLACRHRNLSIAYVYTRQGAGGHLTRARLRAVERSYREAEVYVCGPPGLIAAARAVWACDGQAERVHSESFLAQRPPAAAHATGARVRFAASGIETAGTGTLLERAEQAGLSPAYGCRMGICHTCTTRKLAGRVRNLSSGALSTGEPQDIQLCVSVPDGEVELDI